MNGYSVDTQDFEELINLSTLLRHVVGVVPSVPHAMALDLLRQKFIDFCVRTKIMTAELVMDYQSGVVDYQLCAPEGYQVFSIVGIEGGHYGYYWYGMQRVEFKHNFDVIDNNVIRLRSVPSVDRKCGLKVFVNLIPTDFVNQIPLSLATPYGRRIALGVVADCLRIPGKDWTNPQLAQYYEREYEKGVLDARSLAGTNRQVRSNDFKPVRIV